MPTQADFWAGIEAPAGFIREESQEKSWMGMGQPEALFEVVTLHKLDNSVSIEIRFDGEDPPAGTPARELEWHGVASGHTEFDTAQGRRTFDQRGVSDSFYIYAGDTLAKVQKEIDAQIARAAESVEKMSRSEKVPGLPGGYTVTPELKDKITKTLKAGGGHNFMPAGFGLGYYISPRPTSHCTSAPAALAQFFSVPALYIETLDCD